MAEEKTKEERPRVTRRQFVAGAVGVGLGLMGLGCLSREAPSTPEPRTTQLKNQLRAAFGKVGIAPEKIEVRGSFDDIHVADLAGAAVEARGRNLEAYCLPVGTTGETESPYKVGYLRETATLFPSLQVTFKRQDREKPETWDVVVAEWNEKFLDNFEFKDVGGWDRKRLETRVYDNDDRKLLINIDGNLALFCPVLE